MDGPKKKIEEILVPIDFSQPSKEAMLFACDLAQKYQVPITLLHVYQLTLPADPQGLLLDAGARTYDQLAEGLRAAMAEARAEALAAGAPRVSQTLVAGVPYVEIVRVARESGCDLIVMGTQGRTGIRRMLLGSVAEKVVRHAHCPVLTVRSLHDETDAADPAKR